MTVNRLNLSELPEAERLQVGDDLWLGVRVQVTCIEAGLVDVSSRAGPAWALAQRRVVGTVVELKLAAAP